MAYISADRIVIVDVGKNILLFANKRDSTYVETTLPFEWTNVTDSSTVVTLEHYATAGTVKKANQSRMVLGRKCELYKVETWIEADGERFNERDDQVWLTTDLPVDWEVYEKISINTMRLLNYDDDLIEQFSKVDGFTMASSVTIYLKGFGVNSTSEIMEIIETAPIPGIYSLPDYFKKKERLTMADLRN
jgi:hypothetical protein